MATTAKWDTCSQDTLSSVESSLDCSDSRQNRVRELKIWGSGRLSGTLSLWFKHTFWNMFRAADRQHSSSSSSSAGVAPLVLQSEVQESHRVVLTEAESKDKRYLIAEEAAEAGRPDEAGSCCLDPGDASSEGVVVANSAAIRFKVDTNTLIAPLDATPSASLCVATMSFLITELARVREEPACTSQYDKHIAESTNLL